MPLQWICRIEHHGQILDFYLLCCSDLCQEAHPVSDSGLVHADGCGVVDAVVGFVECLGVEGMVVGEVVAVVLVGYRDAASWVEDGGGGVG